MNDDELEITHVGLDESTQVGLNEPAQVARDEKPIAPDLAYLAGARAVHTRLFSDKATQNAFGASHCIGRFRVLRLIGEGGMGKVYEAHDPRLDRSVAIKLITSPDSNDILTEGQSLAKVEHANVVRVLEIGTHEGDAFIVMEYVDGQPLSTWMEQTHDWVQILTTFIDACRGLIAVHEQNLVHRDFKPGNVMITKHGRVCVVDFGLARDFESGLLSDQQSMEEATNIPTGDSATRSGRRSRVAGTLRYMPLEQLLGREVGPASDQFSFCSALYEALWRRQPFPGEARQTRIDVLQSSEARTPNLSRKGPPRALWPVLRRGLARDPNQRWPNMAALARELERILGRRRRITRMSRLVAGVAVSLGIGVLVGTTWMRRESVLGIEMDGIWTPEQSQALRDSATAHMPSDELGVVLDAVEDLDEYWQSLERTAAEFHVASETRATSAHALEMRKICLEDLRDKFGETTRELLSSADESYALLPILVHQLTPPTVCLVEREVTTFYPLPTGVELVLANELYARLRVVYAKRLAGKHDEARALVTPLLSAAQQLGYSPLIAATQMESARIHLDTGVLDAARSEFLRVVEIAYACGDERLMFDLSVLMAKALAFRYREVGEAEWMLALAQGAWERAGRPGEVSLQLEVARALCLQDREQHELALAIYKGVLSKLEEFPKLAPSMRPTVLHDLSTLEWKLDHRQEALSLARQAVRAAEAYWGPNHFAIAINLGNLGLLLVGLGEYAEAEPLLLRAAAFWQTPTASRSPPSFDRMLAELGLAQLYCGKEEHRRARAHYNRVIEMSTGIERLSRSELRVVQEARLNLAKLDLMAEEFLAAKATCEPLLVSAVNGLVRVNAALCVTEALVGLGEHQRAAAVYADLVGWAANEPSMVEHVPWGHLNIATFSLEVGALEHAADELELAREAAGANADTSLTFAIEFVTAVLELRRGNQRCTQLRAMFEPLLGAADAEQILAGLQKQANVTKKEGRCLGIR